MTGYQPLPNTYNAPVPQSAVAAQGLGAAPQYQGLVSDPQGTIAAQLAQQGTNTGNLYNQNLQTYMASLGPILQNMRQGEAASEGVLPGSPQISADLTSRFMQQIAPQLFGQAFGAAGGQQNSANAFQRALAQMVAQASLQRNQQAGQGGNAAAGVNRLGDLDPSGMFGGIGGGPQAAQPGEQQAAQPGDRSVGASGARNVGSTYTPQDATQYPGSGGTPYDAAGLTGWYTGSLPGTTGGGADPLGYGTPWTPTDYGGFAQSGNASTDTAKSAYGGQGGWFSDE